MKKCTKKCTQKEYIILAILGIIITIISLKFIQGFNTYDTYKMHDMGYLEYAKQIFFADGRIFSRTLYTNCKYIWNI